MTAKKQNVLHIFNDPKFSIGYFEFLVKSELDLDNHEVFHYRTTEKSYPDFNLRVTHSKSFVSLIANIKLLFLLCKADKVIVHCLASPVLLLYFVLFPSLAKKAFWVIWGKDLYFFKVLLKKRFYHIIYECFRRRVIQLIPHVITDNLGDYRLLKEWYGVNPFLYRSFSYPSNLYHEEQSDIKRSEDGVVRVLVGNSADPSNRHFEVFEILKNVKGKSVQIISPLSYGDKQYAKKVVKAGKEYFGDQFVGLMELIPLSEYNKLQANLDIAIFAHKRQQAMGNIISLLGMGKKVYIRRDISTWESLKGYGLHIEDLANFDLSKLSEVEQRQNQEIIKNIYSPENLLAQWGTIFDA